MLGLVIASDEPCGGSRDLTIRLAPDQGSVPDDFKRRVHSFLSQEKIVVKLYLGGSLITSMREFCALYSMCHPDVEGTDMDVIHKSLVNVILQPTRPFVSNAESMLEKYENVAFLA